MTDTDQRDAVVEEALTWIGTPWHHQARVKGAGVDCIQFLIAVYHACGLCPDIDTGDYPRDWMMHRDDERLIDGIRQYAGEVEVPGVGDIIVYRFGRCYSHAGILMRHGHLVHAYLEERQVIVGRADGGRLADRACRYFSVWGRP